MSIGARLKEERERLHLSQAELAEMAGVSRVTLGRYEADKRDIGSDFLDRISKLGMAIDYILTGEKLDDGLKRTRALWRVLHILTKELQLDPTIMQFAVDQASEDVKREANWQDGGGTSARVVTDMLRASPVLVLDAELFMQVVEAVEEKLEQPNSRLPPWKKAQLIVLLYRASKAHGRIDLKVLDEALLLADPNSLSPQLRHRLDADFATLKEDSGSESPAVSPTPSILRKKKNPRGSAK